MASQISAKHQNQQKQQVQNQHQTNRELISYVNSRVKRSEIYVEAQ